jgi:hypothetical protein
VVRTASVRPLLLAFTSVPTAQTVDGVRAAASTSEPFVGAVSRLQATVLTHLAETHDAAAEPDAARQAYERAFAILRDLDHPDAEPIAIRLRAP